MKQVPICENNCLPLLKEGNSDAYYYLIRVYFPVLCHFSVHMVKDQMVAEDITNEIFLKLWNNKTDFADFDQAKKFMYVSVKNASLNYLRDRKREEKRHISFSETYLETQDISLTEVIRSELMADVRKAIDSLPEKMRLIFILAYIKQLSNQQIADKLHLSNQTVRNQKAKSLIRIKKMLPHSSVTYILLCFSLLK